jgi:hypothetical protein
MDHDKAKELIRSAPTVEATFATVDAEFRETVAHLNTLTKKRDELLGKLTAIGAARAELESTGESAPVSQPTDKPKTKGTKQ